MLPACSSLNRDADAVDCNAGMVSAMSSPRAFCKILVTRAETAYKVCQAIEESCTARTQLVQCGSCLKALQLQRFCFLRTSSTLSLLPGLSVFAKPTGSPPRGVPHCNWHLIIKPAAACCSVHQDTTQISSYSAVNSICICRHNTCQRHKTTQISSKLITAGLSSSRCRRGNLQDFERQSHQAAPRMSCQDQG